MHALASNTLVLHLACHASMCIDVCPAASHCYLTTRYTANVARDSNNLPQVSATVSSAAAKGGSAGLVVNVGSIDPSRPGEVVSNCKVVGYIPSTCPCPELTMHI